MIIPFRFYIALNPLNVVVNQELDWECTYIQLMRHVLKIVLFFSIILPQFYWYMVVTRTNKNIKETVSIFVFTRRYFQPVKCVFHLKKLFCTIKNYLGILKLPRFISAKSFLFPLWIGKIENQFILKSWSTPCRLCL